MYHSILWFNKCCCYTGSTTASTSSIRLCCLFIIFIFYSHVYSKYMIIMQQISTIMCEYQPSITHTISKRFFTHLKLWKKFPPKVFMTSDARNVSLEHPLHSQGKVQCISNNNLCNCSRNCFNHLNIILTCAYTHTRCRAVSYSVIT